MSLTVTLADHMERQLQALAERQGMSTESFVAHVLEKVAEEQDLVKVNEATLLQQLGLGFTEAQWRDYHELIALRNEERLTHKQRERLIAFTDQLEKANAQRMAVLAELAKRREQPLTTVMEDLGITPATVR